MRRIFVVTLVFLGALALAGSAVAVDVLLKDGTVIHAASYEVQGSYVLVRLENGSQVAYDLGDVDLDTMKAAEKAAEPAPEPKKASPPTNAFAGAMAKGRGKAALRITDQDVSHVDTGPPSAAEKEGEKKPLADHQEGGKVVVQGVRVDPGKEPGTWVAMGQVVNRMNDPVMDVRVLVQAVAPDAKVLGEADLPVAGNLDPGESGTFNHVFKAKVHPMLRVRVFWIQREKMPPASKKGGAKGEAKGQEGSSGGQPGLMAQNVTSPARGRKITTKPVGGGRPPSLQWGGAPAYKRTGPQPTPLPR